MGVQLFLKEIRIGLAPLQAVSCSNTVAEADQNGAVLR